MLKQTFIILALIGLAFSAPQPKKQFHEHFEDFIAIIIEEAGDDLEHLVNHYLEYDEFLASLEYLKTNNFKDLVYEMESLPEFIAVVDYLENNNVDIYFFIDLLNDILGEFQKKRSSRHASGKDFASYIADSITYFPKEKLAALFDEKMANDEVFSTALVNLQSGEFEKLFDALWESDTFQKEVKTLRDNGIDIEILFAEVMAVFGF